MSYKVGFWTAGGTGEVEFSVEERVTGTEVAHRVISFSYLCNSLLGSGGNRQWLC